MEKQNGFEHWLSGYISHEVTDTKRMLSGDTSVYGERATLIIQAIGETFSKWKAAVNPSYAAERLDAKIRADVAAADRDAAAFAASAPSPQGEAVPRQDASLEPPLDTPQRSSPPRRR